MIAKNRLKSHLNKPVMNSKAGQQDCLRVTAALITLNDRLFIAQRPSHKRFGLSWEFPGGKVEPGETLEESLAREIREELCWTVRVERFFRLISHRDEHFSIDLYAFWCRVIGGELCLREHVAYRWVLPVELNAYPLTQADRELTTFLISLPGLPPS